MLSRRQVFQAMAAFPTLGAVGAGALAYSWWDAPPGEGLESLSPLEYEVAQALAEAWMPPGGDPPLSGADANLGGYLDGVLDALGGEQEALLKLLLQAIDDLCVPVWGGHFRHLDLETRIRAVDGWLNSTNYLVRNAILPLLILMGMGWTTHPEVVPHFQRLYSCKYGR